MRDEGGRKNCGGPRGGSWRVEHPRVSRSGNLSEFTREFHRFDKSLQIVPSRDRSGAELSRYGRQQLDVKQTEASLAQMPVQMGQGHLGSVVGPMEHGFAGEE